MVNTLALPACLSRCLSASVRPSLTLAHSLTPPIVYHFARYDPTTRAELEASILASAGLPEGSRFQLTDEDGDAIVLSNSIPNMTRLTLKVLDQVPLEVTNQKKRRHSGGGGAPVEGGGAKKLRSHTQAVKSQVVEMGFDLDLVEKCAATIEAASDDVTVPTMLRALADAERVAAAARSPMHAAARAASEVPKPSGGAKGSEDSMGESVCCICLDGFENNKALFITECGHKYHFGCIRKYCEKGKESSPSCPLCRQSLPTPPGKSKRSEHRNSAGRREERSANPRPHNSGGPTRGPGA